MLPLSDNLKAWKAQDGIPDPLVHLYEVEVADGVFLRLVEGDPLGTGFVTFNGHTYAACAIKREDTVETIEGDLPSFQLAISNLDGVAGGYIELNELDGRPVKIISVLSSTLAPADSIEEFHRIQEQSYNRERAIIRLGNGNAFKKTPPTWAYNGRCRHPYERRFLTTSGCGYPSDVFSPDTRQDLRSSAESNEPEAKEHGWNSLNLLKATAANVALTLSNSLYLEAEGTGIDWDAGIHDGVFVFKEIDGDFDVHADVEPIDLRVGALIGFLIQERLDQQDSWLFFGHTQKATQERSLRIASAEDAAAGAKVDLLGVVDSFFRISRAGNVFTCYRKPEVVSSWTVVDQRTIAMDTLQRVGFLLAAPDAERSRISGSYNYVQFLSGGLATCSRNWDGPDGCEAHGNTAHFWGIKNLPIA